ncbi:MAG: hypothetical protein OPY06_03675 [Nitrosopumilus sp.]|nr:hypothetical protein [Nitrosopumilus sp.]MDF2422991.1 hypothetical protein [Nitrosopumilus sp.]MDF2424003.1 hypothetical protein [Nitrosopumilus sp.]MDF2428778.1 hypothetical protein [Nitrosopumilus sp.]MDF2430133.1 hypothetical protein [Nitrosopumilus sp.]
MIVIIIAVVAVAVSIALFAVYKKGMSDGSTNDRKRKKYYGV